MTEEEERDAIDRIARTFISTPYHDLGEVKGRGGGVDCATLIKLVFIEAGQIESFDIGHYSPQHFLHSEEERYLGWVTKFAREIPQEQARHGDVVLYRIGLAFAHGAIIVKPGWPHIVHAHYAARCVLEASGTAVHLGTPILGMKFFTRW